MTRTQGHTVAALAIVLLGGCKWDETEYIERRVEAECEFALACYDAPVLEFYGWTDAETCVAEYGPRLTGATQGCTYDAKAAKDCVKGFKDLDCAAGDDPTTAYPEACLTVFTACDGVDDTDVVDDTDADTDV